MAMTFEQWFSAQRQQMLGDAERDIITRLAESLRDPFAPAPMSPDDAFDALAEHTLPQYTYSALAQGITPCLQNHILNCGAAADLVVGVLLYLSGTSLEVQRFLGAVNGNTARSVLTPSSEHPGVRVTQNVTNGDNRMLFSGGHTIALVAGNQYDLISGLRGHHLDYTELERHDDPDGTPAYDGTVDDVNYHFRKLDYVTPEGLSTYRADPEMD
jgi:hypothetical protein